MQRALLATTTVLFTILTGLVLWQHGYLSVFAHQSQNLIGAQVFADLAIVLSLAMIWMWNDAKLTGRSVWGWILLTLIFGAMGPLFYLLTRKTPGTEAN